MLLFLWLCCTLCIQRWQTTHQQIIHNFLWRQRANLRIHIRTGIHRTMKFVTNQPTAPAPAEESEKYDLIHSHIFINLHNKMHKTTHTNTHSVTQCSRPTSAAATKTERSCWIDFPFMKNALNKTLSIYANAFFVCVCVCNYNCNIRKRARERYNGMKKMCGHISIRQNRNRLSSLPPPPPPDSMVPITLFTI